MNCPELIQLHLLDLQVHVQVCAGLLSIVKTSVTEGHPVFQLPFICRIPEHSDRKQKNLPSFLPEGLFAHVAGGWAPVLFSGFKIKV